MTEETIKTRAQRIWELEQEGRSKKDIATTLDIDESTIYREKRKPDYIDILLANRAAYLKSIENMEQSEHYGSQLEAMKERGRMDRAGGKLMGDLAMKQMETETLTPEQEAQRITEERKRKDHLFKEVLMIQPWQYERLTLHFRGQPYTHIDEKWKPTPKDTK